MIPTGRSRLLRLREAAPKRARPFGKRRLLVILILGLPLLLAWSVANQIWPKSGPSRLLYQIHDQLWVPLWARVWTATGGGAMIWMLPLGLLALIILAEFLGLTQVLRRTQIRLLRIFLRGPLARPLFTLQQKLGWGRGREGLLLMVIRADLAKALRKARLAQATRKAQGCKSLLRLAVQLAYLRPSAPAAQIAGCEALALAADLDPKALPEAKATLLRIWPEEGAALLALSQTPPEGHEALLLRLRSGDLSAPEAAAATLSLALPEARADLKRAWLTEWARRSHMATPDRPRLAEAEGLIDFSHWAAMIEARLPKTQAGWFDTILPAIPQHRDLGELSAAGLKDIQNA